MFERQTDPNPKIRTKNLVISRPPPIRYGIVSWIFVDFIPDSGETKSSYSDPDEGFTIRHLDKACKEIHELLGFKEFVSDPTKSWILKI